jgi:hypothetical protein
MRNVNDLARTYDVSILLSYAKLIRVVHSSQLPTYQKSPGVVRDDSHPLRKKRCPADAVMPGSPASLLASSCRCPPIRVPRFKWIAKTCTRSRLSNVLSAWNFASRFPYMRALNGSEPRLTNRSIADPDDPFPDAPFGRYLLGELCAGELILYTISLACSIDWSRVYTTPLDNRKPCKMIAGEPRRSDDWTRNSSMHEYHNTDLRIVTQPSVTTLS